MATRVLPCLVWMSRYDVKRQLPADLAAGVAVAFLIVPQARAAHSFPCRSRPLAMHALLGLC